MNKGGELYYEMIKEKIMQIRKELKEKERMEFTECSIIRLMQKKSNIEGKLEW